MLIDTNVIIRFLTESPEQIDIKFRGVFSFFDKIETAEVKAELPDLVLFQAYYVLTSYYKVPYDQAAEKLHEIIVLKGIRMRDKEVIKSSLRILRERKIDLVDAYLWAYAKKHQFAGVYSFDNDLKKLGLTLLPVE